MIKNLSAKIADIDSSWHQSVTYYYGTRDDVPNLKWIGTMDCKCIDCKPEKIQCQK